MKTKKIFNYIFKLLGVAMRIVLLPLYLLNALIPKNNKIWVFGSWKGKKYNDNSKALFEYVNKNKNIRAIWLTRSKYIYEDLRKKGYECYEFYSIRGIFYSLISKVAVISVSYLDLPPYIYLLPWKTRIIQLWHGTPLKNLNNKSLTKKQQFFTSLIKKYIGRNFDLIISSTNLNIKIYKEFFKINDNIIKITGQPRNDNLLTDKKGDNKIILYLPTWREYCSNFDFFKNYNFNLKVFDDLLEKLNAKLLIKLHSLDYKNTYFLKNYINSKNIEIIDIDDIYSLLPEVDILITDYSSVYFDFLLLNRPIIFAPFDLNIYMEKRGFYYDYKEVTPGPKARNWTDVMSFIEQVIVKDIYGEARELINEKFNYWHDGKSSERVFKEIINIINNNE